MILYEDRTSPTKISISLQQVPDGGLSLAGHDTGKAPRECFGSDDYEYVLTVPADGLLPLTMALLAEKYRSDPSAVSRLRDFCQGHSIPCSFWSYP